MNKGPKGVYKKGVLIIGGREFTPEDFEQMKKVGYKAFISGLNRQTLKFEEEVAKVETAATVEVVEDEDKTIEPQIVWATIPRGEYRSYFKKDEVKVPWYKRIFKK